MDRGEAENWLWARCTGQKIHMLAQPEVGPAYTFTKHQCSPHLSSPLSQQPASSSPVTHHVGFMLSSFLAIPTTDCPDASISTRLSLMLKLFARSLIVAGGLSRWAEWLDGWLVDA